ncbi:hypothetical protein PVBG_05954 [Plasmodium vivax Brazil I]|uniref:Uncharacterized protein n=1 Tax=Plasmodium vivax (strain Brazil I) TaxID=1033975 RepID=A0A0J9T1H5_PLAV1|nr:hypothetical protein PVBG_05954 [Plasmodium vivax Brazil I]
MDISLSHEINYPFLKKIWNLFEDFSNELVDDNNVFYVVCDEIAADYSAKISEYKKICKILLKNLESVSLSENKYKSETEDENFEDYMNDRTRCINLNRWLYYYTKIHHVPDDFIEEVFSAMDGLVKLLNNKYKYTKCVYESYSDDYAEPEDIIKLLTFVDNHDVIQSILMNEHSNKIKLQNYKYTMYKYLKTKTQIFRVIQ